MLVLVTGSAASELSDGLLGAVGAAEAAEREVGGGTGGMELVRPVPEGEGKDERAEGMPEPEG